jgi:hypothetical protein
MADTGTLLLKDILEDVFTALKDEDPKRAILLLYTFRDILEAVYPEIFE